VAFLYFNFDPAKVFMGDTGSLVIGFFISVCSIKLFALQNTVALSGFNILPQLIIGTLFVLIFDLTRVVFIRIFNGISPFKADRSHLHHMVCRQEFGHRGATVILAMFNLFFISLAFVLKYLSAEIFTLICFCLAILLLNSKVISVFALVRNKLAGIPKKKFGVDSSV
jgi:UDP-N-acetylmuramyl pentapeptide phosphotransferase/UDP-N-acetylglucosamine-1-phosphate transferase